MDRVLDFIAIASFFAVLGTPVIAYRILQNYSWGGLVKVLAGVLIAAALSIVLMAIGTYIIFR